MDVFVIGGHKVFKRGEIGALILQMIKFGLVGVLNTGVTYAVYYLLSGLNDMLAWAIGYAAGMACSLIINTRWTFRQKARPSLSQTIRFALVNLVTYALSGSLVARLTGAGGWSREAAGLAGAAASALLNFIGSRIFVFRDKPSG